MPITAVAGLIEWIASEHLVNASVLSPTLISAKAAAGEGVQARVMSDPQDVARLLAAWGTSEDSAVTSPFQGQHWMCAMDQVARQRGAEVVFAVAGSMEQPTVILPLAVDRRLGIRIARWLTDPLGQYGDGLVRPGATRADVEAAWHAACRLDVDALVLRNVREGAACAGVLKAMAGCAGTLETARFLDLVRVRREGGLEPFLGKSVAKRVRLAERRLGARGDVAFAVHVGAAARGWAEAAIALKRDWLEERGLKGRVLGDPLWCETIVQLAGQTGGAVSTVTVGGDLAAAEIGFHHDGHYVAYLGAFDRALAKCSPGRLQMHGTIQWCLDQGFKTYDLLAPDDEYKREWTSHGARVHAFGHARTTAGRAYLAARQMRPRVKAAYYALPPVLRRLFGRMRPQ